MAMLIRPGQTVAVEMHDDSGDWCCNHGVELSAVCTECEHGGSRLEAGALRRPRLLDLFCCQGGAAVGYHRAGFDVVGVDIEPQPHYPFEFHQADATAMVQTVDGCWHEGVMTSPPGRLRACLGHFDAIHASPPCQHYSVTKHTHSNTHPDLVGPTRDMLQASGLPWVMENVVGAPMPGALVLCGSEFNLKAYDPATEREVWLKRHRLFESNLLLMGAGGCSCYGRFIGGVYGGGSANNNHAKQVRHGGYTPAKEVRGQLLGVDWMTMRGQSQAIPPAYTEFIGEQLIRALGSA
jgi:DNA (cytosine-5)-methyltransferase 1